MIRRFVDLLAMLVIVAIVAWGAWEAIHHNDSPQP